MIAPTRLNMERIDLDNHMHRATCQEVMGSVIACADGFSRSLERAASLRGATACQSLDTGASSLVMPVITRFFGVVIAMYHREHGMPHFHARYGEFGISVDIETAAVRGTCSPTVQRLVLEWAAQHKAELLENWRLAKAGLPLNRIKPLE